MPLENNKRHFVKSVQIRENTKKLRKKTPKKTPYLDTFHAVSFIESCLKPCQASIMEPFSENSLKASKYTKQINNFSKLIFLWMFEGISGFQRTFINSEAATAGVPLKKVLLKVSQNSQENT